MTCDQCRVAGEHNRKVYDSGVPNVDDLYIYHPKNCECTCMHRMPTQWEDMYSCPRPYGETNE